MKNEKIKFRDRLKDISSGLGESLKKVRFGEVFLDQDLHLEKVIQIVQEIDHMLL